MLGFRLIAFIGLCGLLLIIQSFSQCRRRDFGKDEPQTMTAEEAIQRGPGDNAHVIITDFALSDEYFEVSGRRSKTTWVPLTPLNVAIEQMALMHEQQEQNGTTGELYYRPQGFRLILKMPSGADDDDLTDAYNREQLQGMLLASMHSVDGATSAQFRKHYPSVNMKTVRILELDARPAGYLSIIAYFVGGLLVMLFAGYLGLKRSERAGLN